MGGGGAIGAWLGGVLHDVTGGYAVGHWVGMASLCVASMPFFLVRSMART
jgi:predicted MFS family arabinose efflux permease